MSTSALLEMGFQLAESSLGIGKRDLICLNYYWAALSGRTWMCYLFLFFKDLNKPHFFGI